MPGTWPGRITATSFPTWRKNTAAPTGGSICCAAAAFPRCELKRLYVHPGFRGHGYARRLVETVLSDAAAIGYRQVLLDTFPFLTGAIALYRDLGFREVPSYNGSPMPELIYMALELPVPGPTAPGT